MLGFKKGHFFVVDNDNLGWIAIKVKNIWFADKLLQEPSTNVLAVCILILFGDLFWDVYWITIKTHTQFMI